MKKLTCLLFSLAMFFQVQAADINKQLFKAIKKGNLEEVKQLINAGADVNALNQKGFSPLHIAVASNNVPIMEKLVEHGADLFYQCEVCCDATLLSIAAFNRAYAAAEYLLANGLNVNGAELLCETPLQGATGFDDIKMMKMLLAHGADVNRLDRNGENALWYAGSKQAFNLLYEAGINLHVVNDKGYSILIYFWHQKFEGINEILCTLFYEGVIFHVPDKDHYTNYNKNFSKPVGFDSLLIFDQADSLEFLPIEYETPKFIPVNDTFIIAQRENEYYVGINVGIQDNFEMERVLSICISRYAKNNEKYNGITGKYFSPLSLEQESAWAHIKYKGDHYYALKDKETGYILIDEAHCNRVKFFNLLLLNPETDKKIRIYGENSCLNE